MKKTLKDKAVDEAKLLAKLRANFICEECSEKDKVMHGAHIMPVTYNGTAADPYNLLCLCPACHSMGPKSAHQNPGKFIRWLDKKFPGRYDECERRALEYQNCPFPKKDWVEIRNELKLLIKQEFPDYKRK